MKKKTNKTYYFSVEGETEVQYFHWLQLEINALASSNNKVFLDAKACQNPKSRAKNLNHIGSIDITNVIDIEGKETKDIVKFNKSLDSMKDSENLGKKIKYNLAYSNLSFELWILLHKKVCCQSLANNKSYLKLLNDNFNQNFSSLDDYKKRNNFERVIEQLSLDDVKNAINRAKSLEPKKSNQD